MKTMKYVELNGDKTPKIEKFEDEHYKDDFEKLDSAGLILGVGVTVIDFDGDNDDETRIINYIESNYPTSLSITTNRGKHFYFTTPKGYKFPKKSDVVSAVGYQCDYVCGEKSYVIIKLNGKVRETNIPFTIETINNLPVLPEFLYPLPKVKEKLSGLVEGESRNNKLFYHLRCVREVYPKINIEILADTINKVSFWDKLKRSELNSLVKSVNEVSISDYKDNNKVKELSYSSFNELLDEDIPPITFYVDGLIPQGTNILCSVPKLGKSWFGLDLGLCISSGLPFLGLTTTKAGCLYLALEDNKQRLQERLQKLLNGAPSPTDFYYAIESEKGNGLIEQLKKFIEEKPNVKVIIIDTLQKVRDNYTGNANYSNDYKDIGLIKQFADANGLCVILIHHLRKASAYNGDIFERILGTNGVMGTTDNSYILYKKNRNDKEVYLSITGRDVDEETYELKFDKNNTWKWDIVSTLEEQMNQVELAEYFNSTLIRTIRILVKDNKGEWSGTCKELLKMQKDKFEDGKNPETTKQEVKRFTSLLKTIDGIDYIPAGKSPSKDGRIQTFKKITVDTVATVDE